MQSQLLDQWQIRVTLWAIGHVSQGLNEREARIRGENFIIWRYLRTFSENAQPIKKFQCAQDPTSDLVLICPYFRFSFWHFY